MNLVRIDIENITDERRLPHARLEVHVSEVAWVTG